MSHRLVGPRRYRPMPGIDPTICIYCGEPADARDHVLPRTVSARLDKLTENQRGQLFTVPACMNCNSVAGSHSFDSIFAKRDYIRGKLLKRNAKLLAAPTWTEAEIRELRGTLKKHVRARQAERARVWARLTYDGIPAVLDAGEDDE